MILSSKKELKEVKQFARQKAKDIVKSKGQDVSNSDLLDLCLLNKIADTCEEELEEFDD